MANFSPLLPKTTKPFPGGPTAGDWHMQAGVGLFNQLASVIDCSATQGEINSIPSPWSRPLQLLSAVRNPAYPTRTGLISQYRGFLALLALSENLCLNITAARVIISECAGSPFAKSLSRLSPRQEDNIIAISGDEYTANPWNVLYVFSLDGNPIGMSSAATIVSPASFLPEEIEAQVAWVKNNRFDDPTQHLNPSQCSILAGWLQRLANEVLTANGQPGGNASLASTVAKELNLFATNLVGNIQVNQPKRSDKRIPYQIDLSPILLRSLYPAAVETLPSNVQILPSVDRETNTIKMIPNLYLIDPDEMPIRLDRSPQNLFVIGPLTLANLTLEKAKAIDQNALFWRPEDFFLDELYYLEEENALPGSWIGNKLDALQLDNLTIILPVNPRLREYISSNDLKKCIEIEKIHANDGDGLRITLSLTLSGFDGNEIDYSVHKSFPLNPKNRLQGRVPSLAIWPHIPISTGWKKYFTFVEASSLDPLAFQVSEGPTYDAILAKQQTEGKSPSSSSDSSSFLYYKSKTLPQYLVVSVKGREIGVIPISSPAPPPPSTSNWTVGVDFGTSLTNVAIRKGDGKNIPEKMILDTLLLSICSIETGAPKLALREYFIPDNKSLAEASLPIAPSQPQSDTDSAIPPFFTIATTRGQRIGLKQTPITLEEGRIYFTLSKVDFSQPYYHTNIKWSDDESALQETFLEQLIWSISAQAAYEGVRQVTWKASFPTAFNQGQINSYMGTWQTLVAKLRQECFDVDHVLNFSSTHDTESVVFAQYCAAIEGRQLENTACIDIGGGTSDVSIWKNRKLMHQCSIQYAGRDVFHHILRPSSGKSNVAKLGDILGLGANPILDLNRNFDASIDVYLRYNSKELFGASGSYRKASNSPMNLKNKYFRSLMAFSFGGLYYYLGVVLRSLKDEGLFDASLGINPAVILGGNGARFLRWIHPTIPDFKQSQAHVLLNQILTSASGLSINPMGAECTSSPKSEACLGLAVDPSTTRLEVAIKSKDDHPYAGLPAKVQYLDEDGKHALIRRSHDRFDIPDKAIIAGYSISDFSEIDSYIEAFNHAIGDLDSDEFLPLQFWSGEGIRSLSGDLGLTTRQLVDNTCTLMVRRSQPAPELGFTSKLFEPEPPFITVMKCLTRALAEKWAEAV